MQTDALIPRHCARCLRRLPYPGRAARHGGLCGICWSQGWCDPLYGARVPVEEQRREAQSPELP